jgi:hypothetical protein
VNRDSGDSFIPAHQFDRPLAADDALVKQINCSIA